MERIRATRAGRLARRRDRREAAGGDARAAIMVGDSATDIRTARAAGIPVVAVDFGYSAPPVAKFQPDRLIGHFDALPAAVPELLAPD